MWFFLSLYSAYVAVRTRNVQAHGSQPVMAHFELYADFHEDLKTNMADWTGLLSIFVSRAARLSE